MLSFNLVYTSLSTGRTPSFRQSCVFNVRYIRRWWGIQGFRTVIVTAAAVVVVAVGAVVIVVVVVVIVTVIVVVDVAVGITVVGGIEGMTR